MTDKIIILYKTEEKKNFNIKKKKDYDKIKSIQRN